MLRSPTSALAARRRGVRQLRADAHQVASHRLIDRAGGFNCDVQIEILEPPRHPHNIFLDHGLAAGDDYMSGPMPPYAREDPAQRLVLAFGLPGSIGRIAPGTAQIATAGA